VETPAVPSLKDERWTIDGNAGGNRLRTSLADYISALPEQKEAARPDPLAGAASPGESFWKQLRASKLVRRFCGLIAAHLGETLLLLASWVVLGSGALNGRIDRGWLAAWALCIASALVLRTAARWLEGVLSVGLGGLLKQRLLAGAMVLDADLTRRRGAGELLSQALEAESLERLGATGGLEMLLALVELMVIPAVFICGAAAVQEIAVLAVWVFLMAFLIAHNVRLRSRCTGLRLGLTHRLVENMAAHRTRLAQQPPHEWHLVEDYETEQYTEASRKLDRCTAVLEALFSRGYLMVALVILLPSFLGRTTVAEEAITLGGVLFAYLSFQKLSLAVGNATSAYIAWKKAKPMFEATRKLENRAGQALPNFASQNTLQLRNVSLGYEGRLEPVLKSCTLTLHRGDRLLLEGDSGSGKSSLALLMGGMRRPSEGFILAGGLDLHTIGDQAWRRRVAVAPQYHENYMFSSSLSVNLLASRHWPHTPQDLQEAREVCSELGLAPLLERMPGGLDQIIGETGWQMSQGERSRVFLARALLQRADLVVLDESLAALDPDNLETCLECVLRRAETLVLIAHP
jgi:ATP-binding cassette, subfamily B, bacterial